MRPLTRRRLRAAWAWAEPIVVGSVAGALLGALFGFTYVFSTGGF